MKKAFSLLMIFVILSVALAACGSNGTNSSTNNNPPASGEVPSCRGIRVEGVSGAENKQYARGVQEQGCKMGYQIVFWWKGSIEGSRILSDPAEYKKYAFVWTASQIWIDYGDVNHVTSGTTSMYTSPIVFLAEHQTGVTDQLGWSSNTLKLEQIFASAESKKITFGITNPTLSNSGNNEFMAILDLARRHAGYENDPVLTEAMLQDPAVGSYVRRVFAQLYRNSESTGDLADYFVNHYKDQQADGTVRPGVTGVFVYESTALDAISRLKASGVSDNELPRIYYVMDAIAFADSPFAPLNHDGLTKEQKEATQKIAEWLHGDEGQRLFFEKGARVSNILTYPQTDIDRVFGAADLKLNLIPAAIPSDPKIIRAAMNLYQAEWRHSSCTVLVTDHSGSMNDFTSTGTTLTTGIGQLNQALSQLLDQKEAEGHLVQATANDFVAVVPFSDHVDVNQIVQIKGNDPASYSTAVAQIVAVPATGGTDIYQGIVIAIQIIKDNCSDQLPAIIVMTDGDSQGDRNSYKVSWDGYKAEKGYAIPIFSITFGNAKVDQLKDIAAYTSGKVYDGTTDLWGAFVKAKGNN